MKTFKSDITVALLGLAALAFNMTGCGLGARQVVLQDEDYAARLVSDPVVEMMIEYPAPHADFAYAPAFTLQVVAREGALADMRLYHGLWNDVTGAAPAPVEKSEPKIQASGGGRAPASVGSTAMGPVAVKRYPKAAWQADFRKIREEMKDLALAAREPVTAFYGCSFPVKLRMVRQGGTVEELSGCRGAGGWTRRASESIERWVTAQR
jgi:hypothetical protein